MQCMECMAKNMGCNPSYNDLKKSVNSYQAKVVHFIARHTEDQLLKLLIDLEIRDNCYSKYAKKLSALYINKTYFSDEELLAQAIIDYLFYFFGNPNNKKLKRRLLNYRYRNDIYTTNEDFYKNQNNEKNEKRCEATQRLTQNKFRNVLLKLYSKCSLCGICDDRLLVASHIKPWTESNSSEKTDKFNGLLLCCNHDRLFDRGLIAFDDTGCILISDSVDNQSKKLLNIKEGMKIRLFKRNLKYLQYHRENVFIK